MPRKKTEVVDPDRVLKFKDALVETGTIKGTCKKLKMDFVTAKRILEQNPLVWEQALTDNRRILEAGKEAVAAKWLELAEEAVAEMAKRVKENPDKVSIGLLNMIAGTGWDKAHQASKQVEEKQISMSVKAVQELFKTAEELGREMEKRNLKPVMDAEVDDEKEG